MTDEKTPTLEGLFKMQAAQIERLAAENAELRKRVPEARPERLKRPDICDIGEFMAALETAEARGDRAEVLRLKTARPVLR